MGKKLSFLKTNFFAVITILPVLICLAALFWAKGRIQDAVIARSMGIMLEGIYGMCQSHTDMPAGQEAVRHVLEKNRIGPTGYIFAVKATGSNRGTYIISRDGLRDGENTWNTPYAQEIVAVAMTASEGAKSARIDYFWQNPGERAPRAKVAYVFYYKPWDWVIGASVYADEAHYVAGASIVVLKRMIYLVAVTAVAALVLAIILGYFITLWVRTQEREAEDLRRAVSATIVHDLKNPLSAIANVLDLLHDKDIDDSTRVSLVNLADRSIDAQRNLINTYMDVEKMESSALVPHVAAVDLPSLVASLVERIRPVADSQKVSVHTSVPENLPPFFADRDLLERVLWNLLSNAFKYAPAHSFVRLGVFYDGERFRFEVRDSGPGIPESARDRLFGKFYRVESGGNGRHSGTGLGLYFCKLAVEAHGGTIGYSPVSDGALLWFELPGREPAS